MSPTKVWFITGTSAGLGRAMAEYALSQGDKVVATLRKPEALADLATKYNSSHLLVVKLDVTKPQEIIDAFSKAHEVFGRIDVVHNNAGYGSVGEIEGTSDEIARGIFEVNFWGSTNIAREAVRYFRDVNKPSGGRLLQASSMVGVQSMPGIGYYSASKYALEGISEALSKELIPAWDVKVTILQLGGFSTRSLEPESLIGTPLHPAYKGGPTESVREYLNSVSVQGDTLKAVREIYKIASDPTAPLHLSLGLDAIATVTEKLGTMQEDLEKSAPWSVDLKPK
ncbi:NAD-P-binding protein [Crucibulum laeve]|uniref:NAD-P-binding protein n=1 Tax=Crucibulum laeve TaxID=68775 RepID=A0A5C3MMG2_9AGAR|nr:NAD-P-binding protein [Crucibulum laeve]